MDCARCFSVPTDVLSCWHSVYLVSAAQIIALRVLRPRSDELADRAQGSAHAVVPRWLLSARPLAANLRSCSQGVGLQHASSKRAWALSISLQGRCRARYSRPCRCGERYALYFQFFSSATRPTREIIVVYGLYMSYYRSCPYLCMESARDAESRSRGAMFAVGSRRRAKMIYARQSCFRPTGWRSCTRSLKAAGRIR